MGSASKTTFHEFATIVKQGPNALAGWMLGTDFRMRLWVEKIISLHSGCTHNPVGVFEWARPEAGSSTTD
jgi:hypothetical protein